MALFTERSLTLAFDPLGDLLLVERHALGRCLETGLVAPTYHLERTHGRILARLQCVVKSSSLHLDLPLTLAHFVDVSALDALLVGQG